ncbi:MAG: hypothetical protein R3298_01360 [Gammaproteobacteria bacterium]|nr:hypothetical protein [Gammaproteobacteria bacterium]
MPAPPVAETESTEIETIALLHPGLIRFAEAMRRNHPGITDEEIAELFEAWSR